MRRCCPNNKKTQQQEERSSNNMPANNEARTFIPVRIAVLTISDTRTLDNDTSGQTLADRIAEAGHQLSARKIIKDDVRAIRHVVRDWTNRNDIDAMISTG